MSPLVSFYYCTFRQNDPSSCRNCMFSQRVGSVIGALWQEFLFLSLCVSLGFSLSLGFWCLFWCTLSAWFCAGVQKGVFPPYAGIGSECLLYLQHVPIIALTYTFSPLLPGKVFCHARFAEFCFGWHHQGPRKHTLQLEVVNECDIERSILLCFGTFSLIY